jgi:hypothetical protein
MVWNVQKYFDNALRTGRVYLTVLQLTSMTIVVRLAPAARNRYMALHYGRGTLVTTILAHVVYSDSLEMFYC